MVIRSYLKSQAFMTMAASAPSDLISKSIAYNYRKEIESRKISHHQGKGLPRVERDTTEDEIETKKRKLAERQQWLQQNGRGPYKTRLAVKIGSIKGDTKAIKKGTEAIKKDTGALLDDTKAIRNSLEGKEVLPKEGQTDKERIKEIRMVKQKLDNEAGDIKARESKRLHEEKRTRQLELQEAAETAKGCADSVVEDLDGTTAAEKKKL
jgi:hypothetical protein